MFARPPKGFAGTVTGYTVTMSVATVNTIMAQLIVTDLETSVRFYEPVLGRGPDERPMDGLAVWRYDRAGVIQGFQEPQRARRDDRRGQSP